MSDAKSYEGRYHMPGWFYIVVSKSARWNTQRVYKVGGTTVGPDERLWTLNYQGRYGVSDWEYVSVDQHIRPFHIETAALRNMQSLKISSLNGRYCGREMLSSKTEKAILDGALAALENFEKRQKLFRDAGLPVLV